MVSNQISLPGKPSFPDFPGIPLRPGSPYKFCKITIDCTNVSNSTLSPFKPGKPGGPFRPGEPGDPSLPGSPGSPALKLFPILLINCLVNYLYLPLLFDRDNRGVLDAASIVLVRLFDQVGRVVHLFQKIQAV
jgi:hypothetical protein